MEGLWIVPVFPKKRLQNDLVHGIIPSVPGQTLGCRQAVRHQTLTLAFVGSNPAIPAKSDPLAQLAEQLPFKQWVRGSNPRRVTKTLKALGLSGFFVSSLISTRPTAETSISEKGSGSDLWQKSECKWLKKVGKLRKSFLAL